MFQSVQVKSRSLTGVKAVERSERDARVLFKLPKRKEGKKQNTTHEDIHQRTGGSG